jgi:hypothetical protein
MAMRRRIAIALYALGAIVGYGSGIAHLAHAHRIHAVHCAPSDRGEAPAP